MSIKLGLALKGGMAMRAAHGSVRYTKDIDLAADPGRLTPEGVKAAVRRAFREVEKTGIVSDARLREPKFTDTTQRWKLNGMIGGTPVNLTVEVSRRDAVSEANLTETDWREAPGGEDVRVAAYDMRSLAASKVSCLCSDRREAVRDLFDLDLLIRMDAQPAELLAELGRGQLERYLGNLWDKVEKLDWAAARESLVFALPPKVADRFDEDVWEEMRVGVGVRVEQWLREALEMRDAEDAPEVGAEADLAGGTAP